MIYWNIFCLAVVVVFIVDVSGAVHTLKEWIGARRGVDPDSIRLKPLDCSLCMTWWAGFLYILIAGFSLPRLAAVALAAALSREIGELVFIVENVGSWVCSWLTKKLEKLWKANE